jgi:putative Mg2+ transporter-C (MgtC) family protein
MTFLDQLLILGQVALASIFAGLIGLEREAANKPAGARTHILLASAATLFVALAAAFIEDTATNLDAGHLRADPLRIIQAIVAGVAFLGAGTIIRSEDEHRVEGLTTATSLLLVAGIGVTVALELYLLAALITVFSLVVLRVLGLLERALLKRLARRQEKSPSANSD